MKQSPRKRQDLRLYDIHNNKKCGFIFIDLLLAITASIILITFVFSLISLITFYYTLQKDRLHAYAIILSLSRNFNTIEQTIKKDNKEFKIQYTKEHIEHTPIHTISSMPLIHIIITWKNYYDHEECIIMKVPYVTS